MNINKKNKKYIYIIALILVLILIVIIIASLKKKNIIKNIYESAKKEENNLDITYHIEGNNEEIKCCIKFESSLNSIEYIKKPDGNIIYPNKKIVAIDYNIESENDYLFKIKCEGESEYLYTITNKQEVYPKINQIESRNYALITQDEIKVDKYTIDFGGTSNNYYSIDEGKTWNEYTGQVIDVKKDTNIIAKTINGKNSLNKVCVANINWASNAMKSEGYDGDLTQPAVDWPYMNNKRIDVSEDMWGKNIRVYISSHWNHGPTYVHFYNENDVEFSNVTDGWFGNTRYWQTIIIPDYTKYIIFGYTVNCSLFEVEIIDDNAKGNEEYTINNAVLKFNKIIKVGENEELKTLKEGFDYLCDNNYKENVAIVLKDGEYTTQDMQTGSSDNLNKKYDKMDISIIADNPGSVIIKPGEIGMSSNGQLYGITLKFYRIIFKESTGFFHMNLDNEIKEYYNCIINTPYGGYYNEMRGTSIKVENCLFNSETVNQYYQSRKISGLARNCASINSYMDPANGAKTTCLFDVTIDNNYNITSNGWEHTGTGTNPDGTQANIGVYGGKYSW